jgi:hypothetical protein
MEFSLVFSFSLVSLATHISVGCSTSTQSCATLKGIDPRCKAIVLTLSHRADLHCFLASKIDYCNKSSSLKMEMRHSSETSVAL